MRNTRLILSSCGLIVFLATHAYGQPAISSISPGAVQPGKTVELTISGAKLDDPLSLWASFPGKIELLPGEANKKDQTVRKCKITLEPTTPVGIAGLFAGTTAGVSDVFLTVIDDLDSVADNGANHTAAMAQKVELPIAIDGASDGSQFDYYAFTAKAGQRVSAEVIAARVASPFDGVMRLLDPNGAELLIADDSPGTGADPRFSVAVPSDGTYLIELRDNKFGGGRYRLRVGDFPLVSVPYPLGARLGSMAKVGFAGQAAEGTTPVILKIPEHVASGRVPVNARYPNGKSSGMATLATSPLPELAEVEPNNDIKTALPITVPCAVSGILSVTKDQDFYQFPAVKGQPVVFRAVTRSLGSPTLLVMRLLNAEGNQLAESAVNDADEFTLAFSIPADGMYNIVVEDLLHRGGPDYAYRLEIGPNPGFSLSLKNDPKTPIKFVTPAGNGAIAADVQVARAGFDGAIRLSLEGEPAGYRLINPEIPAKAAAHRLVVMVPPNAQPGELRSLRIVGNAVGTDRNDVGIVSTNALIRTRLPLVAYPPNWIDGLLTLAVGPSIAPFFATNPTAESATFPRIVGQTQVVVNLERKNAEFKDGINLSVEQLPTGFASAIKQDKDQFTITITGPKDAPEGKHTVQLVGYGEFKGQGVVLSRDVVLDVIQPIAVAVAPAGPIVAGQKQKVKLTLTRKGADKQPVTLKWKKLPAGVTAEPQYSLTAEQNEIEVELTAAADAAAVNVPDLSIDATTKYSGADIAVSSAPVPFEVKRP